MALTIHYAARPQDDILIFMSLDVTSSECLRVCCAAWLEAEILILVSLDVTSSNCLKVCCAAWLEAEIPRRSS